MTPSRGIGDTAGKRCEGLIELPLTPEETKMIAEQKKANQGCVGCLVIVGIVILIYAFGGLFGGSKRDTQTAETASPATIDLRASVRFTGTLFIVENNDAFTWYDVKMEINGGAFTSGYILETPAMAAAKSYTAGAMQFAKPDGTRFNPWKVKARNFAVHAKTDRGEDGYWFGSF